VPDATLTSSNAVSWALRRLTAFTAKGIVSRSQCHAISSPRNNFGCDAPCEFLGAPIGVSEEAMVLRAAGCIMGGLQYVD